MTPSNAPSPSSDSPFLSRRRLLAFGAAAAAGTQAQAGPQQGPSQSGGAAGDIGGRAFDVEAALVHRTSFGISAESIAEVRARGFAGYLDWQLDPDSIDDSYLDARLALLPSVHMSAPEIADNYPNELQFQPAEELRTARAMRAALSKRQLYERMVEFWTDHFNVPIIYQKRYLHYVRSTYDREVIRTHALGNFGELMHAVARSAAMLKYLDGYRNTAGMVNENFARELLELMTLGAGGPYNEQDVHELARAFTGWQFHDVNSPDYGDFYFDPTRHEQGPKQILGLQLPAGGEDEASIVLDFLATHPVVAERLAAKLGSWLLGYEPPAFAVNAARDAFMATGGDIEPMIRALLTPQTLVAAGAFTDRKLKRPLHFGASLLRATGARFASLDGVREDFEALGQPSFDWSPPNGYPDAAPAWIWLQYPRLQFATDVASASYGWLDLVDTDLFELVHGAPRSNWGRAMLGALTADVAHAAEARDLQAYVNQNPGLSDIEMLRELLVLAALAPSFQEY